MNGGAAQYLNTEIANVQQTLLNAINAPAQTLLGHPMIGTAQGPAAAPAQAETTITTPFGPVTLSASDVSGPAPGDSGPVGLTLNATTPLGSASLSLAGWQSFWGTGYSPTVSGYTFGTGTIHLPSEIPFLVGAAGPIVTGGTSLMNSASAYFTAVGNGNMTGAANALSTAPSNFVNAVLFGHTTVEVPFGSIPSTGQDITWGIPFSGLFASPAPLEMSLSQGNSITISPDLVWSALGSGLGPLSPPGTPPAGDPITLTGTEFGGIAELLNASAAG